MAEEKRSKWPIIIIIILTLLLLITILGLCILSFRSTEAAAIKELNERQLVLAKKSVKEIEFYFDAVTREMSEIGTEPGIENFNESASREALKNAVKELKKFQIDDVAIIDKIGTLRFSANNSQLEGENFSSKTYFKEAKKAVSNERFIIEFIDFKSTNYRDIRLAVVVPMFINENTNQPDSTGKFSGLVISTLPLDSVTDRFVAPTKASKNGHSFLIDNKLHVLFSPDVSQIGKNFLNKTKGFPSFQHVLKDMAAQKTSFDDYSYLRFNAATRKFREDKQKQFIAYTPFRFKNGSWSMGVWASEPDAIASTRSAKNKLFLLVGVITIVLLLGSGYIMYLFSRSAKTMQNEINIRTSELRESETKFRRIAETLQSSLIKPVPKVKGMDIWVAYESAYEVERVGGDFFDIFELEDKKLAMLVGDVSGKGVEAAGLTETIRSSVRTLTYLNPSPSYVLEKVNEALLPQLYGGDFITAILVILDRETGNIRLASAGHPPPVITSKDPVYASINNNYPLGLFKSNYQESSLKLEKEHNIILYTDGLTEARRGSVYFGEKKIFESLSKIKQRDSKIIVEELMKSASNFEKGRLRDDVVVASFRFI